MPDGKESMVKPGDSVLIRGVVVDVDGFDDLYEVGVRVGDHSVYYFDPEYVEREQHMARNVNEIINSLPAARRRKINKRAAKLIAQETKKQLDKRG